MEEKNQQNRFLGVDRERGDDPEGRVRNTSSQVRSRRGRKTIGKQSTTLRILEVRRDGSKVKVRVGGMSSPAKSRKGKKTIGKSLLTPHLRTHTLDSHFHLYLVPPDF
jgi:hypothetical protein